MKLLLVATLFLKTFNAAPPLVEDETEKPTIVEEDIEEQTTTTTTASIETPTSTSAPAPAPVPTRKPVELLSGKERFALIGHLGTVDLKKVDKLILTPRQQIAISQEIELHELGLPAFHDPNPWERLTKEEQLAFNENYLSLSPELQEFAKSQFVSSPDDILSNAFHMFINLDLETLSQVLRREADILQGDEDATETLSQVLLREADILQGDVDVKATLSQVLLREADILQGDEDTMEILSQVPLREADILEGDEDAKEPSKFRETEIKRIKARRKLTELPRNQNGVSRAQARRRINFDPRRAY